MNPLVSVLIPAYNAELWIAQAIKCVLNQTWPNLELIVVDDGSTDNTLAVAQHYHSEQVKIIHQPNQGAAAARNRAYRESQGMFIQYLDADDLLSQDKIARQVKHLLQAGTAYVSYSEWVRFIQTPNHPEFDIAPNWGDISPIDWLVDAWENHKMIHPAAWLLPRTIVEKAGLWNESLSLNDDGEYFCRVALASHGLLYCQGAFSYYRTYLHEQRNNLSSLRTHTGIISAFQSFELCTQALLSTENTERTRSACAAIFQSLLYTYYPYNQDILSKAEERVRTLGGAKLAPFGGYRYQLLVKLIGWKMAKKLKELIYIFFK